MTRLIVGALPCGVAALSLLAACSGPNEPRNSAVNTDANRDVETQSRLRGGGWR